MKFLGKLLPSGSGKAGLEAANPVATFSLFFFWFLFIWSPRPAYDCLFRCGPVGAIATPESPEQGVDICAMT